MSVSYTAPSLNSSGTTFNQFQTGGIATILVNLVVANSLDIAATTRILGGVEGASRAIRTARDTVSNYLSGYPVDQAQTVATLADCSAVLHALAQSIDEAGTLIAANPGTVVQAVTPAPDYVPFSERTWS